MRSLKVTIFLLLSVVNCMIHEEIRETGTEGSSAVITCSYTSGYEGYSKYFCKGTYKDCKTLIKTNGRNEWTHEGRVSLHDITEKRKIVVTITDLRMEDAGSYGCGIEKFRQDPFTLVFLRVVQAPKPRLPPTTTQSTTTTASIHFQTQKDPPKNISVSISPSGEIVEGSSVNLTCSSDANPPVKNYTWFKEGGTSPVGSGHSYSIINITAEDTGLYYCVAQNEHGAQRSNLVLVSFEGNLVIMYTVGIAVAAGICGIAVVVALYLWRRKKQDANTDQQIYANVNLQDRSSHLPSNDASSIPDYENLTTLRKQH